MILAFKVPIYRAEVALFIATTVEEFEKFYKDNKKKITDEAYQQIKKDLADEDETGGANYICGISYITYIRNPYDENSIAHELYHLTNNILTDRGVEHTLIDEPYAYLNGYLHTQWKECLKEYKKEKKDEKARRTSGDGSGTNTEREKSEG